MLGVSPDADSAQIVRAYRRRARAVHPDVSTEQDAGAQFSALWAAYQLLLETAHEPGLALAGDDQGSIVDQHHRRRVPAPAPGPLGGWPAGWAGRGDAWLVAGPARVEPSARARRQPGQPAGRTVGPRPRSRPAPDDGTNRVEPGHG
ncbi:DnaJ domain-containing protein [Nocardioides endophyticus]